jgi:hypothetical protein
MDDDKIYEDEVTADDVLEASRKGENNEDDISSRTEIDDLDHITPAESKTNKLPLDDPQSDSNVDSTELYQEGMLDATHDFALPNTDDDDEPDDIILREPGE